MNKSKTKDRRPDTSFAKKSFGQNFLIDQNYIHKIVSALNPQQDEIIIEIGSGRGALTEKLIESGASVIGIEIDRDLLPLLKARFGSYKNFALVDQDVLKIDFHRLIQNPRENANPKSQIPNPKSVKLVANLPYYISTAILQKLIEQREAFSEMVLMFQREVVERIMAGAGTSERGFLTVLVQAYLRIEKLFDVPPTAFRPVPKVWSSVVRLTKNEIENAKIKDEKLFREIISTSFARKRKTILNNLKIAPENLLEKLVTLGGAQGVLDSAGIEPSRRAETLTIEEWHKLFAIFQSV